MMIHALPFAATVLALLGLVAILAITVGIARAVHALLTQ